MSDSYKSLFLYHLGTAHMLKGNLESAKEELRKSLAHAQPGKTKGFILNNLGVCCWWHRYPNFRDLGESEDDEPITFSSEKIIQDYEQSINLFK